MAAFIVVAVIIVSAAVLADAGSRVEPIDVDRMAPPLPENVAAYEPSGSVVALAH
jgi:hypothetical protein